jgi:pSer/pThr/pTyr-binding forkhead associated (FHA) protein
MNVVLVMLREDGQRSFPLGPGTTSVGRATDCALRIPAADVSRHHCEFTVGVSSVHLRDVGSSNGTFLNGKRVQKADLQAGDRVRVGPVLFVVQVDGLPADVATADREPTHGGQAATDAVPQAREDDDTEEMIDLDSVEFDVDDVLSSLEEDEEEGDEPSRK